MIPVKYIRNEKQYEIIIGIDPDVDKSGIAILHNGKLAVVNWRYFEIFENLKVIDHNIVLVVIEKGQENKAMFNAKRKPPKIAAAIGMKTGRNFEVTNKIAEMCEFLNVDHEFYKPTSAKLSHDYLSKIVDLPKRTNEEQRDAVRCILRYILN